MGKKAIPVAALVILLFVIVSISGCAGIAGAPNIPSNQHVTPGTDTLLLHANETSLNFASVNIGSNSTLPVILTNAGNSNITISNVTISGAGYTTSGVSSGLILTPGQTVTLNAAFAPAGTGLISGSITITSDATNSPTKISLSGNAVQSDSHSVLLSWTSSRSVVAGYNVYRSQTSGGPYSRLDSSLVVADSYVDSNVQAGKTYYYVITSVISSGVESADSAQTLVTIP